MSAINLFIYDIPEVRVTSPATGRTYSRPVMPNPSARMWDAGAVRLNFSCWLIHDGNTPYTLIADFKANGVNWQSAPFDPSAALALTRIAAISIRKEIADYVVRARETARKEDARLKNIRPGVEDTAEAHRRYRSQLAAVARRVRQVLHRVEKAAARFNITPEMLSIPDAATALAGIREGMEARADAFAKAQGLIVKAKGKKDAMAVAMQRGDVFAPVAADYLEELGGDGSKSAADSLRTAFGYDFG